jgi:hypothetical protein
VVEKQVDVKIFPGDFQPVLPPDKGKALAEFEEELFQMANQVGFQFALVKGFGQGQKVEDVGVLERLLGQVGLWAGQ